MITLIIGTVLSALLFSVVAELLLKRQLVEITKAADGRVAAIQVALESELAVMDSVVAFHEASDDVTQQEFETFAGRSLARHRGIDLVAWVPALREDELDAFEQQARQTDFPDYQVIHRQGNGALGAAPVPYMYYPVRKIFPLPGNEPLVGLDLGSVPAFQKPLAEARSHGGMQTVIDHDLIARDGESSGLAIFRPFFRSGRALHAAEDGAPRGVPGYVVVRIELGRIVELALQRSVQAAGGLDLFVHETDADGRAGRLLYYHPSRARQSTADPLLADDELSDAPVVSTVNIGDFRLTLVFRPLARVWVAYPRELAWLTFAVAMLATLLIAGFIVSVIRRRDVAEGVAVHRSAMLADSAERFRAVVETVVDGIITIGTDGRVESFNPAAERIFGYARDEVIGRNVNMLMPEPYHAEHDRYIDNYLTTGQAKVIGTGREVTGQRKDRTTFPLELSVSEMKVGTRRMFTGIVRDISERKRIDRMKTEFISVVSHELRTPLTSIRGSLGLIAGGAVADVSPKIKALLDIATNNCERLVRLINDILDVEKIEAGKLEFDRKSVDPVALVSDAINANQMYADAFGVQFRLVEKVDGLRIFADADRITQVVTNLLSNAAKYAPRGDTVEVAISQHDDRVRVAVTDHGSGIPDEFRAEVFMKFSQADSSDTRQKGGTGLGLSICKAIVEKHQGHIAFESTPDVATTFYFDLPAQTAAVASVGDKPAARRDKATRVLVCEDDKDVATLIALMLERDGRAIDIAYSAEEAKALLAKNEYQAMTLDLMLPGQDGISLLRELRNDERTQTLPVVVISAKADEGRRELSGGAVGVVDWLSKPIDQGRLVNALRQVVKSGGKRRSRILHVEDDRDLVRVVAGLLAADADVVGAHTIAQARQLLEQSAYDLVVLDMMMPDGSGEDLLPVISACQDPPPVIVFSGHNVSGDIVQRVNHVLTKGHVSGARLIDAVRGVMRGR